MKALWQAKNGVLAVVEKIKEMSNVLVSTVL
jgi:hypothetical protein